MSRVGLDWYKREPVAYLGDVQGLSSKEHAVYSVVIDLLYVHGGSIRNDPKWIAGWVSDMGTASVRKTLDALYANPRITIEMNSEEISQNRAKNEAKTKRNLRETAQKHGKIGGEKSAELRREANNNNNLVVAHPSTEIQAEKIRLDKSIKTEAKASIKKAARLSDGWFLPKEWGDWAVAEGVSLDVIRLEADQFKDYWIGIGGQRATKLDWFATWRNWIRRSSNSNGSKNGTKSYSEHAAEKDTARIVNESVDAAATVISRRFGRGAS